MADGACRPLFAFHDRQGFQYVAPCAARLALTFIFWWPVPDVDDTGNGATTLLDDGIRNGVAADVMLAGIAQFP